jgi:hypothetical protein
MKRFIVAIVLLFAVTTSGGILMSSSAVDAANPTSTVCNTLGSGSDCATQPTDGVDINKIIATVINIFSAVIGVVAVIMIMVSGFNYVTSGGDSNKTATARSTLMYAIVGLVIVALAQVIVNFVLNRLNAPDCAAGKVVDSKTNKCVDKKPSKTAAAYYYTVADTHYRLNYSLS